MADARTFCAALRDVTIGQRRRWIPLDHLIAHLGLERGEADGLVARLNDQGMLELADDGRLRLTEKGRRATGAARLRRFGIRLSQAQIKREGR